MTSKSEVISSRNIGLDIVKSTAIFFVVGVMKQFNQNYLNLHKLYSFV